MGQPPLVLDSSTCVHMREQQVHIIEYLNLSSLNSRLKVDKYSQIQLGPYALIKVLLSQLC